MFAVGLLGGECVKRTKRMKRGKRREKMRKGGRVKKKMKTGWGEEEVGRRKRRKTKGGQEAEGPLLGPHRCRKPQESKETRGRADMPLGAVLTTRA